MTDDNELDVTPEGSVAPVLLDTSPSVPTEDPVIIDDTPAKEEAVEFLIGLGMTEEMARAVVGMPLPKGETS